MADTPIKGYTPVSERQRAIVNQFKELEERTLRLMDTMRTMPEHEDGTFDPRFLAVARTEIQKAYMAANRAVMNPQRVQLPEDHQPLDT